MAGKIVKKWVDEEHGREGYTFFCPGCNSYHTVSTKGPGSWGWNGSEDKPTFTPSVLVRGGHYLQTPPTPGNCACDYHIRHPDKEPWRWPCTHCHSFVRDGMIQFLGDCHHALKNQTVPLPPLPRDRDE